MNDSAGTSSGPLQSIVAGSDPEQTALQIFHDSGVSDVIVFSRRPCILPGSPAEPPAPRSEEYASEFRNNGDGSVSLLAQTLVSADAVHDLLDGNAPSHGILLLSQDNPLPTQAGRSTEEDAPLALITFPSGDADRALVFDIRHAHGDNSSADDSRHHWGDYRAEVSEVASSQMIPDTLARSAGALPETAQPNGRDTETDAVWAAWPSGPDRVVRPVSGTVDANLDDPMAEPAGGTRERSEVDFRQEGPVSAFSATPDLDLSPPQIDFIPVGEKSLAVVAAFLTGHARRSADLGVAAETRTEGTLSPVPVGLGAVGRPEQESHGDVREAHTERGTTGGADEDTGPRVGPLPPQSPAPEQTSASRPAPGLLRDRREQERGGSLRTVELLLEIFLLGILPRVALQKDEG